MSNPLQKCTKIYFLTPSIPFWCGYPGPDPNALETLALPFMAQWRHEKIPGLEELGRSWHAGYPCLEYRVQKLILPDFNYNLAMDKDAEQDPRVYFAAERTFLAWIRTGLGLIGIGFAVSRFGLFLRQLSASESHLPTHTTGMSVWSGVTLVGLGVLVMLSSVLRHLQLIQELKSGTWAAGRVSRDGIVLGLVLAAAGIGMCAYLVLMR